MTTQKTILLIDDEPDLREMIQFQLQAKGFKVVTAQNGEEGIEHLKTIKPDVILLDMNMPKMGGLEFYERIKGEDKKTPYPIIALTAQMMIEGLFEGFDIEAFVAKPFTTE